MIQKQRPGTSNKQLLRWQRLDKLVASDSICPLLRDGLGATLVHTTLGRWQDFI